MPSGSIIAGVEEAKTEILVEMLGGLLEKVSPGALFIFSTSMYLDPVHFASHHIEDPKAPGFKDDDSQKVYLEPYNQEIRAFTAGRGYRLADTFPRLISETQKGKWDLQLRADEGDPREDSKHVADMTWFDNMQPNGRGTENIIQGWVEGLLAPR